MSVKRYTQGSIGMRPDIEGAWCDYAEVKQQIDMLKHTEDWLRDENIEILEKLGISVDHIADLEYEIGVLRVDAERYQCLRELLFNKSCCDSPFPEKKLKKLIKSGMSEEDALDYALDYVLRRKKRGEKK